MIVDLTNEDKFEFVKSNCDYDQALDLGVKVFCKGGELKYRQFILRIDKSDLKQLVDALSTETPPPFIKKMGTTSHDSSTKNYCRRNKSKACNLEV